MFSPRKRRCFPIFNSLLDEVIVFSAQAEVFPVDKLLASISAGFLRASGGVSSSRLGTCHPGKFSPRKRRCFYHQSVLMGRNQVFSAQAEVFPVLIRTPRGSFSFLRASGGVSKKLDGFFDFSWFSPRKRRCFQS